jgi:hypothetical protein
MDINIDVKKYKTIIKSKCGYEEIIYNTPQLHADLVSQGFSKHKATRIVNAFIQKYIYRSESYKEDFTDEENHMFSEIFNGRGSYLPSEMFYN